jgi:hypothetical protein
MNTNTNTYFTLLVESFDDGYNFSIIRIGTNKVYQYLAEPAQVIHQTDRPLDGTTEGDAFAWAESKGFGFPVQVNETDSYVNYGVSPIAA